MKKIQTCLWAAVTMLAWPASSWGATVVVDWLALESGGSPSSFNLVNDNGLPVAVGSLIIESGKGQAFPGFPSNNILNAGFWSSATEMSDSVAGDRRVGAVDFRVVPQAGAAGYVIELAVPAGRNLVLAVGGLFRSSTGATQSVVVSAFSEGGVGTVSLIQTVGWDSGTGAYDQELEWDGATGVLSTTAGSNGDSEIAFLGISALAGADARIRLSVPNGYGLGTGDSITIGLGQVIPEPGTLTLVGLCGVFLLVARRR